LIDPSGKAKGAESIARGRGGDLPRALFGLGRRAEHGELISLHPVEAAVGRKGRL